MTETTQPADDAAPPRAAESVRNTYDWSEISPSIAVVDAVAERTGRDPSTLDPLYEVVETDALDRLVSRATDIRAPTVSVTFTYGGCDVVVRGDGTVAVEPYP